MKRAGVKESVQESLKRVKESWYVKEIMKNSVKESVKKARVIESSCEELV